ncbi:MAG: ATP-binding protein [Lachnospiraceae bacterium]|nr:ATP-binding protein [Lachnospiraceae bacterium]
MSLTNMQYNEIIRSYNKKDLENKRKQNERIDEVYHKVPRIGQINDEISSLSLETTKKLLLIKEDVSSYMEDFHTRLHELKEEKARLLKENGFAPDYLDMHYTCPDCRDTGYINNVKCHCFKKAEIELLYDQSNLKEILSLQNFNSFNIHLFDDTEVDSVTGKTSKENMAGVVSICHRFSDNFKSDSAKYKNLLFFGRTGVGKSFLTHCIAKELIEHAFSVIYLSAIQFFSILSRAEFDKTDTDAKSKYLNIMECDLLIIDDLGTELSTSFTNSAFFNVINERLLKKKSVVISTNLNFPELMERYSERLTSRLTSEYTFLKIYGHDLRHPN